MASAKGMTYIKHLFATRPEIFGVIFYVSIGLTGGAVNWYKYDDDIATQHKWTYTVMRKEDARPEKLAKGIYT